VRVAGGPSIGLGPRH